MTVPVILSTQAREDYLDICAQGVALSSVWEQQSTVERRHRGRQPAPELPAYRHGITVLVGLLIRALHHKLPQKYIYDALLHLPSGLFERLTNLTVVVSP